MEIVYIIVLLIIIILIIKNENSVKFNIIEGYYNNNLINTLDNNYYNKFSKINIMSSLINNNKLDKPIQKKNKILFITYDNRYNEEYVVIHNYNINKYVKKYNYEYKYFKYCNNNVYWCKIDIVLNELIKNIYDYIIWLDSDTVIKNFDIDIGNILNMYSSDIFIGSDNHSEFDITNSGVFIIKNSTTGINFLNNCINYVNKKICFNADGTLNGSWAASCYEQGVMNILIADKYFKYTTILTNDIIFNYNVCSNEVFIMHLYASTSKKRVRCFHSKNPSI